MDSELQEHLKEVKRIFEQFDPTGKKGLNYLQFKTVLIDFLDFDDDEASLQEICSNLDPD